MPIFKGDIHLSASGAAQIKNAFIERLTAAPTFSAADEGRIIYDTTDKVFKMNNGSLWVSLTTGGSGLTVPHGFVAITDIEATSSDDSVINRVFSDDDQVLQSCTVASPNIGATTFRVHVLALTGVATLKPTWVRVNGDDVTNLTQDGAPNIWTGYVDVPITTTQTVVVEHAEGVQDGVDVTVAPLPVITSLLISNTYPNVGQNEHAAGQTFTVTIEADVPFSNVQFESSSTNAVVAGSSTVTSSTSATLTVTAADRGQVSQLLSVIARIRSDSGLWSAYYDSATGGSTDGVNIVRLNNVQPSVTIGTITYPASQQALKGNETATVNVTYVNVNSVTWSSPNLDLSVTSPSSTGNKTVTRINGSYNIATNNLQVIARRTANNTTTTVSAVVWIANTAPTITVTTPAARLRSGGGYDSVTQNHTITLTASQRLLGGADAPTMSASAGAFSTAFSTADNGVTWTRTLQIGDSVTKGSASFSALVAKNLAGLSVTTITTGATYTVGGFVKRTVPFSAWPNREAFINTNVVDVTKVRVTNLSKGASGSLNGVYVASLSDTVDGFTITQPTSTFNATGNRVRNNDLANASSNTSGTLQFEIEELV